MPELLIINADDFGGNPLATDRIVECFAAGRITSTTAMVYMSDSDRAAELARSQRMAVGLHLNITQELQDPRTPGAVRERQARVASYFAGGRLRRFTYNPLMSARARRCIADQLERFRETYGREPSHIDGHNHAHLSPTVLLALPKGTRTRAGQSSGRGRRTAPLERGRHALIARMQTTTDYFFAINRLGPAPTERDIEGLLGIADRASVEIMVHPDRDHDFRLLMSDAWLRVLERRNLGSFEQL
jgi:predicted glycoside hydrolase/deacetylase ChbG (UPF0249 family)